MKTQISVLISKAVLIILVLSASVLMPFRVDAATWGDAPIIGINISAIDYDYNEVPLQSAISLDTNQTRWHCASSHSSMGCQTWVSENTDGITTKSITGRLNTQTYHSTTSILYRYQIVFDKSYVGRIHINWTSSTTSSYFTRYLYVNGTSVEFTTNYLYESFSIDSYQLEYAPLEIIDKMQNWDIPIESLNFNLYQFQNNREIYNVGVDGLNYNNYPIFNIQSNTRILTFWGTSNDYRSSYTFIILVRNNIQNLANLKTKISLSDGVIDGYDNLQQFYDNGEWWSLTKFYVSGFTSNAMKYLDWVGTDTKMIFIYANVSSYPYLSSDFALQYGLSNQMLNDLHILAQGTTASNQQSSDLSSGTDSMQQQMNDLVGVEDSYNQQFNNSVNSIDFTNPLQQNAGLLGASNFVISVFNGLIANNPFSILIIIVCILLIGKKVIGK